MTNIIVPIVFLWVALIFILFLIAAIIIIFMSWYKEKFSDYIVLLDKNNRAEVIKTPLKYLSEITIREQKYFLHPDGGIPLPDGKIMYIFSINKPAPLVLKYSEREWLSGETIKAMLSNDLIQQMLRANQSSGMLLLVICICSGIGALAAVFTALKVFGVLK